MDLLKPGRRMHSAAGDTQVVIVRAPGHPVRLSCAGRPMAADAPAEAVVVPPDVPPVLVGKRYASSEGEVELLCTKAGAGPLEVDGVELVEKATKPLPSSD